MASRIVRGLRTVLLIWTGLLFVPAWLVMIRGLFDGDAYSWGFTERIRGRGTGGSYLIVPPLVLFGLSLLVLGWRGAARPFHLLLLLLHLPLGLLVSIAARRNRDALRIQGDTLGIDVSLADVAPVIFGGAAASAIAVASLDDFDRPVAPWSRRNRNLLGVAASLVPLQFALLRFGEQHGLTDKLGVILTITQWALINVGLALREEGSGTGD